MVPVEVMVRQARLTRQLRRRLLYRRILASSAVRMAGSVFVLMWLIGTLIALFSLLD